MYNLLAYTIYLIVTVAVIVGVGRTLHRNGRLYILELFSGDAAVADRTNNLLLAGYYLLNIGYALICIRTWGAVPDVASLLAGLGAKVGFIVLLLAVIHYINMAVLAYAGRTLLHSAPPAANPQSSSPTPR